MDNVWLPMLLTFMFCGSSTHFVIFNNYNKYEKYNKYGGDE